MSRNFGLGSRDMRKAGKYALDRERAKKTLSFQSVATNTSRWSVFVCYILEAHGVRKMEQIAREMLLEFGGHLASRVREGAMKPSYAQNLVSAVNLVMGIATQGQWLSVSATKECGISRRHNVRKIVPTSLDSRIYSAAIAAASCVPLPPAIANLCRVLGLRLKEACLFDARAALKQAMRDGFVEITKGTKGGRRRRLEIHSDAQVEALALAASLQGAGSSMIPEGRTWQGWRDKEMREMRHHLQQFGIPDFRDLRAAYACERYRDITGHDAPCCGGGMQAQREDDKLARQRIALELGHDRTDVAVSYIGGTRK